MKSISIILGWIAIAVTATGLPGATTIWNFNPAAKNGHVGASFETLHGSDTGLNPLDSETPLVTVSGFNADDTAHLLQWKKSGPVRGIGLKGTHHSELTLDKTGTTFANYMRIDMTEPLALPGTPTLEIRMQGVLGKTAKTQERFDVWGSDVNTSFGTKLISGCTTNGEFVLVPLDSDHYNKYYFVTVTPQGKSHKNDTVLLEAVRFNNVVAPGIHSPVVPEPATLSLLLLGGVAILTRRR